MTRLIHVLGSDIPHHNQTILRFFNDVLAENNPDARQFMVVAREDNLGSTFPHLTIQRYGSKRELARALIMKAKADRQQRFFLHGQFNLLVWLGMLIGVIRTRQVSWHIWGADLYEVSERWRFRLLYRIRRLAQRRIAHVFATRGDLHYFQQMHPTRPGSVLYFPTRMAPVERNQIALRPPRATLHILLGNSGDRSNRHITALQEIHRQFGQRVKVVIPMGYPANNAAYIHQVSQAAHGLFEPENIEILTENLPFNEYMRLLAQCDLGYFIFERQQGIGTLCLLIQAGIPCVLSRKNPFCLDMTSQQIPVLYQDQPLDQEIVRAAQGVLRQLDLRQVAFFNPGYVSGWHQALAIAAGDMR